MAKQTMGYLDNAKPSGKLMVQGTLKCSCGASYGGLSTITKGTKRSWTCTRCKQEVVVVIPK